VEHEFKNTVKRLGLELRPDLEIFGHPTTGIECVGSLCVDLMSYQRVLALFAL